MFKKRICFFYFKQQQIRTRDHEDKTTGDKETKAKGECNSKVFGHDVCVSCESKRRTNASGGVVK